MIRLEIGRGHFGFEVTSLRDGQPVAGFGHDTDLAWCVRWAIYHALWRKGDGL